MQPNQQPQRSKEKFFAKKLTTTLKRIITGISYKEI